MSSAFSGQTRRAMTEMRHASTRICAYALTSAMSGASGNAATNSTCARPASFEQTRGARRSQTSRRAASGQRRAADRAALRRRTPRSRRPISAKDAEVPSTISARRKPDFPRADRRRVAVDDDEVAVVAEGVHHRVVLVELELALRRAHVALHDLLVRGFRDHLLALVVLVVGLCGELVELAPALLREFRGGPDRVGQRDFFAVGEDDLRDENRRELVVELLHAARLARVVARRERLEHLAVRLDLLEERDVDVPAGAPGRGRSAESRRGRGRGRASLGRDGVAADRAPAKTALVRGGLLPSATERSASPRGLPYEKNELMDWKMKTFSVSLSVYSVSVRWFS